MRFGETPIDEAAGAILAHSWRANGVNFAKGRVLSGDDVAKLKSAGVATIVAARLDPDDIHEDEAAATLAKALAGEGIEVTAPFTGRCNHFAREAGLAVVDLERHSGKPARTLIEALDTNDLGCAVRCTLET